MKIKKGVIKRIHVNQHIIRRNRKECLMDKPISIKTSKGLHTANEVSINGPSKLIYSPNKPLSCGARLWIETKSEVITDTLEDGESR